MKQPSFLARKTLGQPNYFLLAMAAAFLLALMPRGARRAIESNNNNAADWLPPNYSESVDLQWFRDHFIDEQFALISWDDCTLGDTEKLEILARKLIPTDVALAKAAPDSDLHQRAEWYQSVVTGPQVVKQLEDSLSISYGKAIRRVEGALIGPVKRDAEGKSLGNESRTTCLVVYLTEAATVDNRTMRQAIDKIELIATSECGISAKSLHMGGPPVDNITIDKEGEATLIRLAGLSGIVGLLLSYWCFRSFKLTGIVFTVGVLSAGVSLATVFYFGIFEVVVLGMAKARLGTVDAILMSMPAVVYVLGLSGSIHIVNYYRDARREDGLHGAAETAVRLGWGPCTLAALTTAVGLGSLYTSDILPIKKFGMFTAGAVLLTVVILFTVLPVFLHRFPASEEQLKRQSGGHNGKNESHLPNWAKQMFGFIINRPAMTCAMWFVIMGVFAYGCTKITTSVSLLKLLDEDTDLIHDYAWLEKNLGNLVPMEVILTLPAEQRRTAEEKADANGLAYRDTMLESLDMVNWIQHRIEALPEVSRNMSLATYTPSRVNTGVTSADQSANFAANIGLEENQAELLETGFLRVERINTGDDPTKGRELWRLSARVAALGENAEGVDYGEFVKELKAVVDPVLLAYQQRDAIVAALHAKGLELHQAKICLLSPEQDADVSNGEQKESISPAEQPLPGLKETTQEAVLAELLRRSGIKLAKKTIEVDGESQTVRVVPEYNLAKLDQGNSAYLEKVVTTLSKQDAVVLVSAASIQQAKKLTDNGLQVVDVSNMPTYETSAASPLATDQGPRPIRAVYTGMIPLVYKTQRQLLISLNESILWATVLISFVMMFVLRNPVAGLISMIPNVFPIVMIFGALGWLGIKVDIGIMMTASVALGVAVDDTVHFLTWFRRGVTQGLDRVQSVMLAYDRCATAMLQTTIIGGLGLAVFATSTFTPTQQFGYLMISMLGAALIGDLLLLPAILVSPLGKFFGGAAPEPGSIHAWSPSPDTADHSAPITTPTAADPVRLAGTSPSQSPAPITMPAETSTSAQSNEPAQQASRRIEDHHDDLLEGPHAALHAKLRSLRRDDSASQQ